MTIKFAYGEVLLLFRKRAKLSKKKVAEYLEVTPATITNYEKGFTIPSQLNINKLKKLYGPEFVHALTMIHDYDKKPFLGFKTPPSETSFATSFDEKYSPVLAKIKAHLREVDKNEQN